MYIVLLGCLAGMLVLTISGITLAAKTTVTVWGITQEPENTLLKEKIIPAFEELYPDIDIAFETIPHADFTSKMLAAFTAGRGPDMAWANIPFLMELGFTKPIPEDIIDDAYMAANYLAGHDYKYKGQRHFIPTGTMGCILYYNKDILDEAGIKGEDIGITWDEATVTFEKLTVWKAPMLIQSGYAFNGYGSSEWQTYIRQMSGQSMYSKVGEGKYRIQANTPEAKKSFERILDYLDEYKVNARGFLNWNEALGLGKAAIVPWWTWGAGYMSATYPDINWGAAKYPTFTGHGPYGYANEIDNIYLVTTSDEGEKREATWKFWQFLSMEDENVRAICEAKGIVPLKLNLMNDPWISEREDLVILKEQMNNPKGGHIYFGSSISVTSRELKRAFEAVVLGGEDIEKSLITAEEAINKDLAENEYWILDYRK